MDTIQVKMTFTRNSAGCFLPSISWRFDMSSASAKMSIMSTMYQKMMSFCREKVMGLNIDMLATNQVPVVTEIPNDSLMIIEENQLGSELEKIATGGVVQFRLRLGQGGGEVLEGLIYKPLDMPTLVHLLLRMCLEDENEKPKLSLAFLGDADDAFPSIVQAMDSSSKLTKATMEKWFYSEAGGLMRVAFLAFFRQPKSSAESGKLRKGRDGECK
jgi:hypothetical protein